MRKFLLVPIAVGGLLSISGPAFAWEHFDITYSGLSTVNIAATGLFDISTSSEAVPNFTNQQAGVLNVSVYADNQTHSSPGSLLAGTSFYTYCVELTQTLASPTTSLMDYNVVASTAQVTTAKLNTLGQLFSQVGPSALGGLTSSQGTAFQAAIWEVVYETASGPYNLAGGNISFTPGSVSSADLTWANNLLNAAPVATAYSLEVLHSNKSQDYLVITQVPEPEAYGMALAGLGVVGFALRRRRKA